MIGVENFWQTKPYHEKIKTLTSLLYGPNDLAPINRKGTKKNLSLKLYICPSSGYVFLKLNHVK